MPFGIVPAQARHFKTEHDPHVSGADPRPQVLEAVAMDSGGARAPLIFVDDVDLVLGPGQRNSPSAQVVLAEPAFLVEPDLTHRRLPDAETGPAGEVIVGNLVARSALCKGRLNGKDQPADNELHLR